MKKRNRKTELKSFKLGETQTQYENNYKRLHSKAPFDYTQIYKAIFKFPNSFFLIVFIHIIALVLYYKERVLHYNLCI